ncbi:MAG: hypothetical protein KDA69_15435 [Planctomycetaceae bacterium]|nr:hypothetical protein [Planctomycetaceae bacterium]MCA9045719.1 hypothetical protein [Planctomycetaceae bacterium]
MSSTPHNHDGDCSIEEGIASLVLSFAELSLAHLDFAVITTDSEKCRLAVAYFLGAVRGLTRMEDLDDEQVKAVFQMVISEIFPWSDEEIITAVDAALAAEGIEDHEDAVDRGSEAIEAALVAAFGLTDLLEPEFDGEE